MARKRFLPRPQRRALPARLRAEIMLRQDGRCADCGTRLILGFFVFDHRPPLALRDENNNPNDPEGLAAICWACNERKTPKDLKEIARVKRLAAAHQEFLLRQVEKVPGRRLPTTRQWRELQQIMDHVRSTLDEAASRKGQSSHPMDPAAVAMRSKSPSAKF